MICFGKSWGINSDESEELWFSPDKEHGIYDMNGRATELMQSTGLKAKNGKEIFEGDIVKGWHCEDIDTGIGIDKLSMETSTFAVEWDENVCGWNLYGSDEFEIIGNIYEHSHLLK